MATNPCIAPASALACRPVGGNGNGRYIDSEIESLATDFHRLGMKHQRQVGELDVYVGTIEEWTLSAVRLQLKHNDESTLYDDLFHNLLLDRRTRGFRDDDLFYHPTVRRILDVRN